jgi:hypothetical protein
MEFGEEEGSEMDGAGARDCLEGCYLFYCQLVRRYIEFVQGEEYSVVFDGRAVRTKDQFLGCAGILRQSRDGEVFMVELWVVFENVVCLFIS